MKDKQTSVIAVIPARYGSTRFPGKPLVLIKGRPMVQWVYERASRSRFINRVIVATDDHRIIQTVKSFGGEAVLTSKDHPTGTDRIAEVIKDIACDLIVNVQGDEPLIRPEMIDQAISPLVSDPSIPMGTLCRRIEDKKEIFDPNVVKVVSDENGFALYFSRAPIPWHRDAWQEIPDHQEAGLQFSVYKHIGIYVYRRDFLLSYAAMQQTSLESIEKLEQLRAIERGYKIKVVPTEYESFGVDIPEDLSKIQKFIENGRI